ncbi:HD domain-containing protein 2 [Orchesella cincta]|uniref:5'-deoxynucleotidase HDDC2 n=1 Tax=Orchesella cincta TaxID=48709 RepID=A0A1D2N718_ORCCI|nr:HD domain-containing protein 2 [Orchesella cincta]
MRLFDFQHLDRTGWVRKGVTKPETVAGHMYRMAIMSAFLVDDASLDMNKCIRMSIVHDIGESIIGDITPNDGVDDAYKNKIETEAVEKLAGLVKSKSADEIRQLFQHDNRILHFSCRQEYEEGKTKEAKLVKDLDRFDMVLQAYEYEQMEGKPEFLQEFFDSTKEKLADSHPKVKGMLLELYKARENNVAFTI